MVQGWNYGISLDRVMLAYLKMTCDKLVWFLFSLTIWINFFSSLCVCHCVVCYCVYSV